MQVVIRKTIGTLGLACVAGVQKGRKEGRRKQDMKTKAVFENIIRSAAVRITATTLLAFEPGL